MTPVPPKGLGLAAIRASHVLRGQSHLNRVRCQIYPLMRIDKWLWAARFYKTRSIASDAVEGGHVEVNGERAKPAKQIKPGDELRIRLNQNTFVVHVRGLSERRGPARDAQLLYEETAESRVERERLAEQRRLAPAPAYEEGGRPTKRDRRDLSRVKRRY